MCGRWWGRWGGPRTVARTLSLQRRDSSRRKESAPTPSVEAAGRSACATTADLLHERVRVRGVPREPGRGLPRGDRWEGRSAGHAHRLRQVAVLPVARHRSRRDDAGGQPADRPDGGPGGRASGARVSQPSASTPAATAPSRARCASTTWPASCNSCLSRRSGCAWRAFRRCSPSGSSRWWPSTKPTASRNGATISVRTTA